ncbi:MAG: NTP transferase domain-containing protein [Deltaproteobacteria bacterium]|nr:NTP transferase domain-containing protein [Deltaproteobacteria bacterium]
MTGSCPIDVNPNGSLQRSLNSLAVIPARGGSQRIKDKGIVDLGGRPLIAYTIGSILEAGCFRRVLVSTDSPRIAEVAEAWGAEVPFLRSCQNASPKANLLDAISETLDSLRDHDGFVPDILGIFLPTSPFRRKAKIREIFRMVSEGAQAGNLLRPIRWNPCDLYYQDASGNIVKWNGNPYRGITRFLRNTLSVATYRLEWDCLSGEGVAPSTPGYFHHYLRWFRSNDYRYLDQRDLRTSSPDSGRWIYVGYASVCESMDINTPEDLAMAEAILRRKGFHASRSMAPRYASGC